MTPITPEVREPARAHRRTVTVAVLTLAAVAVVLGVVGSRQPPRVSSARIDAPYAIAHAGSQLTLWPNQPLRTPSHLFVRTSPRTDSEVTYAGDKLIVRFDRALRFDTSYRVTVGSLTGRHTGARGDLTYRFRTPSVPVMILVRSGALNDGKPDRIVEMGAHSRRTVFEDDVILEYADAGRTLVVTTFDRGDNKLLIVGRNGRTERTIDLGRGPDTPVLGLRADPASGWFGYITHTHGAHGGNLFVGSVAGKGVIRVRAADGTPMEVLDWLPVPGQKLIVVQDSYQRVYMVDPANPGSQPILLGSFGRIGGFLPDTTILALPNDAGSGTRILDPLQGIARTLPLKGLSQGEHNRFTSQWVLLDSAGHLARVDDMEVGDLGLSIVSAAGGGQKARDFVLTKPRDSDEIKLCASPNPTHFVAVVSPSSRPDDGYPVQPARRGTVSQFFDTKGGLMRSVPGSQPSWCSSGPTANGPFQANS